jgi:hypothetical protein
MPGMGDCATWGACHNHPHDPRTPEGDDDMSFDGTTYTLRSAADKLDKIDRLLDDLVEFFDELLEERAVTGNRAYDIACFMNRMKNI